MSDTNLPNAERPLADADATGHLAEDVALDDQEFAAEAGIDQGDDPAGTPAASFPAD